MNYRFSDKLRDFEPYRDEYIGFSKYRLCDKKILRGVARQLFEEKQNGNRKCFVIHIKNEKENMIYEGVYANYWTTGPNDEHFGMTLDKHNIHINVKDIIEIMC